MTDKLACTNSCGSYVRGKCDYDTGRLTFTRKCSFEECRTEYTEQNACSTWSEWTADQVGDCVNNKRTVDRTCIPGQNSETGPCPGDDTKEIDCVINYSYNDSNYDSYNYSYNDSNYDSYNYFYNDSTMTLVNIDCSDECPAWTTWGEWTAFFPSCVDELDKNNPDTIFSDLEIYMPKRIRERECQFSNGTTTPANHVRGNCPISEWVETERQTIENFTKCESAFEGVEIDEETEIETKVIVDFGVEIYEEWTPELADPQSDVFTDLAAIYILGFLKALQAINEVKGTSQIQFATVRVIRFHLIEEDFVTFRRKRSTPQDKIRTVFETVYDIIAPKDDKEETHIVQESQQQINTDVAEKVGEQVRQTVAEEIVQGVKDHKPGKLNFIKVPEVEEIVTSINYEKKVLATYSNYFVMDCNCATNKTQDYNECIATAQDVSLTLLLSILYHNVKAECLDGPKRFLEEQGPCQCKTWTSWSIVGNCECYNSILAEEDCRQSLIRRCLPGSHYNLDAGERWSNYISIFCDDDKITETTELTCFLPIETTQAIQTTTQTLLAPSITGVVTTTEPSITKIWVPIVSVIAFIFFVLFIILIICFCKRRKRSVKMFREKDQTNLNKSKILKSSYDQPYEEETYADAYQNNIYNEYNASPNHDQNSDIYEVYQDK